MSRRMDDPALLRAANAEIAQLLLEHGADINGGGSDHNIFSRYAWTPLMDATIKNDLERVKLLLNRGADVNHQDRCGESALMLAAEKGYKDILMELLKHGAKLDLKDEEGQTTSISLDKSTIRR